LFRKYKLYALLPIAVLYSLALTGCGNNPADLVPEGKGIGETAEAVEDFTITLYQGQEELGAEEVLMSDLRGKPLVINYWAGLCPPCRAEMPEFQEFRDEYEGRITLVGVDLGQFLGLGTKEHAQKLLEDLGVSYAAGFTDDGAIVESHRVLGLPTTIFVNANGTLHRKWDGVLNKAKLSEIGDEMLDGAEG
jgi:thiol-disulfide isomerase/thioredoxin